MSLEKQHIICICIYVQYIFCAENGWAQRRVSIMAFIVFDCCANVLFQFGTVCNVWPFYTPLFLQPFQLWAPCTPLINLSLVCFCFSRLAVVPLGSCVRKPIYLNSAHFSLTTRQTLHFALSILI